jgi:hypothetical protein
MLSPELSLAPHPPKYYLGLLTVVFTRQSARHITPVEYFDVVRNHGILNQRTFKKLIHVN